MQQGCTEMEQKAGQGLAPPHRWHVTTTVVFTVFLLCLLMQGGKMKIKANLPFSLPFKGPVFPGAGFLCPAACWQLCLCSEMAQKPSGSNTVLGNPLTSGRG